MDTTLIGRKEEKQILEDALASSESEMVAVIGRRRVGKTFLIKKTYQDQIIFEITGLQNAPVKRQIAHFSFTLSQQSQGSAPQKEPNNWLEAFQQLVLYLNTLPKTGKKVVFFDELPWLATAKSGFLTGLGFFWNSWAVQQNIVVVICGSAASWMIQKVINDTGELYNRVTKRIFLQPFSLSETEKYLKSRHINFNRYQITQIYMAMGGIPHYLKDIKAEKSAIQNIDQICFSQNGPLRSEFQRLFSSLFSNSERHIAVVRVLATTRQGLTRKKLITKAKLTEGGNSSRVFEELEQSGFITSYYPFEKRKKDKLYRLTDEYSLFYLNFIEDKTDEGNLWQHLSQTQPFKTWSGYAYESICLKHIPQIKKALGISGVYSLSSSFYKKGTAEEKGAQIDLLIDRKDEVINICEIKFYNTQLSLTNAQADGLREKLRIFRESTRTHKYLMPILITTFGLKHNQHSLGLIEKVITLDDLFE
jgi:AAA+ ATPase superfamily predicted ATPase